MCSCKVRSRLCQFLAMIIACCWIYTVVYIQIYKQDDLTYGLDMIQEGFSVRIGSHYKDYIQDFLKSPHKSRKRRKPYKPSLPRNHDLNAPGENGTGVSVPEEYKEQSKKLFERSMFNQWASDRISIRRTLPDARHPLCLNQTFPIDLPPTDVVIVFHNEAWSTLLRTVHSILDRSPPDLIHQIILQDDYSDIVQHAELYAPLEQYLAKMEKVKLFRNKKYEGLIRSRLNGFSHVTAPVAIFLDAHCEVNVGWLEPLLACILDNPTTIVCPEIDVIDSQTFKYNYGPAGLMRGTFNWHLHFRWKVVPLEEHKRRKSPIDPIRSPTMAGVLFGISRKNFIRLGTYEKQLYTWGGENIELSFKAWLCGGKLEIVPCSRVGHVFRSHEPYESSAEYLNRNSQRIAEVWMDEYKEFFYKKLPDLRNKDYGNITSKLKLRQQLQCKHFKWYLDNVFTDVMLPNESSFAQGKVRNPQSDMCLNTFSKKLNADLGLSSCTKFEMSMDFSYTLSEELKVEDTCLDVSVSTINSKIPLYFCHHQGGNQRWLHKQNGEIRHFMTGLCLDRGSGTTPIMTKCTGKASQIWIFDKYFTNVTTKKN